MCVVRYKWGFDGSLICPVDEVGSGMEIGIGLQQRLNERTSVSALGQLKVLIHTLAASVLLPGKSL